MASNTDKQALDKNTEFETQASHLLMYIENFQLLQIDLSEKLTLTALTLADIAEIIHKTIHDRVQYQSYYFLLQSLFSTGVLDNLTKLLSQSAPDFLRLIDTISTPLSKFSYLKQSSFKGENRAQKTDLNKILTQSKDKSLVSVRVLLLDLVKYFAGVLHSSNIHRELRWYDQTKVEFKCKISLSKEKVLEKENNILQNNESDASIIIKKKHFLDENEMGDNTSQKMDILKSEPPKQPTQKPLQYTIL